MSSYNNSALIGALVAVVLSTLSELGRLYVHDLFGVIGCFSYLACGLVAVWHYTGEHLVTLSPREGISMGVRSGLFTSVIATIVGYGLRLAGLYPNKEEAIAKAMEPLMANPDTPEEVFRWTEMMINFMYGIGGILVLIVIAVVMGLLGGLIGRAIWKRAQDTEATEYS